MADKNRARHNEKQLSVTSISYTRTRVQSCKALHQITFNHAETIR